MGFEWLYQLTEDFRRVLVRYVIYKLTFVVTITSHFIGLSNTMRLRKKSKITDMISTHSSVKSSGGEQENPLFTCPTDRLRLIAQGY